MPDHVIDAFEAFLEARAMNDKRAEMLAERSN